MEFWHLKRAWHLIAPFHSWLRHPCQESRKPEIEMFDVCFKCCSHWRPCKTFEMSPSWGLRHRTIYSCIFTHFWVLFGFAALATGMRHQFPRCFGGFLRDPAFSARFWGDLQPLLGGCAVYSCIFGFGFAGVPVYSCGVLVDFLQILQFQQFVVGLGTLFWDCGNVLRWLAAPFGVVPSIPAFLGFGWVCMFSTMFW